MHYYKRNLGDYAKKAGRLTMLQHGAYNLLIDACYDREDFPTRDEALDWAWACTPDEIDAVEFVLRKFFVLQDGKYIQKRIQEELEDYQTFRTKQAENGKLGGRPKNPVGLNKNPVGFKKNPVETQWKPKKSLTTNHKPLTTNQEPKTKNQEPIVSPPTPQGVDASAWDALHDYRTHHHVKRVRDSWTDKAQKAAAGLLSKLSPEDQNQCVAMTVANGWQGIFPDKLKTKTRNVDRTERNSRARQEFLNCNLIEGEVSHE